MAFHDAQLRLLDAFGTQAMAPALRKEMEANNRLAFADIETFAALIAYVFIYGKGSELPGDALLELVLRSNANFRPDYYVVSAKSGDRRDAATAVASHALGSERFQNVAYRYMRLLEWSRSREALAHDSGIVLKNDVQSAISMPIEDWLTASLWLDEALPDGAHPPTNWPLLRVDEDVASVDGLGRLRDFLAYNAWTRETLHEKLSFVARGDLRYRAHMALLERPLISLDPKTYLIASPRGVENAVGPGWYYRTLDWRRSTSGDDASRALTSYFGKFFEQYIFETIERVAIKRGGRCFSEQRDRGRDSTDVVLLVDADLYFLEVVSGRIPVDVIAHPDEVAAVDLAFKRLVLNKTRQLRDNLNRLLSGQLRYEGLDVANVQRIFPIVVQSKSIPRNATVHALIDSDVEALMSVVVDSRVFPIEIIDAETIEGLEEFLQSCASLGDLIAEKTASAVWRAAGFKNFVYYQHPEYQMRLSPFAMKRFKTWHEQLQMNFVAWKALARLPKPP